MTRRYETAAAFKTALEERLRSAAASDGVELARLRQLLVFERFLARVLSKTPRSTLVKGGFALELRLERARTTKDVDLRMDRTRGGLLDRLQDAGRMDLEDWLTFEVTQDARQPEILADGLDYGGGRFRVQARLAGRPYAGRFGLDLAIGEPRIGRSDEIEGSDMLRFIGIERAVFRVVPIEVHIAEKLHAYTLPRTRPNSRVKDLPDMALLSTAQTIAASALRAATKATFANRGTHEVPSAVPAPSDNWAKPYERMARIDSLPWASLGEVTAVVQEFLDPLLAGATGTWQPRSRQWR